MEKHEQQKIDTFIYVYIYLQHDLESTSKGVHTMKIKNGKYNKGKIVN